MELKVWVEGIQRIVCGVTVNTTCQDVVFALAHATGKVGRFTLIERWRNNERLLAPNENPLKLLLKWGEYANDVQFILQRSEQNSLQHRATQHQPQHQQTSQMQNRLFAESNTISSNINQNNNTNNNNSNDRNVQTVMKKPFGASKAAANICSNNHARTNTRGTTTKYTSSSDSSSNAQYMDIVTGAPPQKRFQQQLEQQHVPRSAADPQHALSGAKEMRKSFGAHDSVRIENVGIVKGVPHLSHGESLCKTNNKTDANNISYTAHAEHFSSSTTMLLQPKHEKSHSNPMQISQNTNGAAVNSVNVYTNASDNVNVNVRECNSNHIYSQIGPKSKSTNEINLSDVRDAIERRNQHQGTDNAQHHNIGVGFMMFSNAAGSSSNSDSLTEIFNINQNNGFTIEQSEQQQQDLYKNVTPTISANGALVPPPYRNPPPPRTSPLQQQQANTNNNLSQPLKNITLPIVCQYCHKTILHDLAAHTAGACVKQLLTQTTTSPTVNVELNNFDVDLLTVSVGGGRGASSGTLEKEENAFQTTQYNDLLALIKFQREKINLQQTELNKYDAEIVYLESKERDQAQELEAISQEITKSDQIFRQGSEQLQTLQYVEEENELVKQQEKTLKSEIALLRSKLANCETELLQCKNKIRILMDDIEIEQRSISTKQKSNRQIVERDFLIEMERIQSEIDQAIHNTDTSNKTTENLKKEILMIENAIAEKKRQVEQLVNEMKEVNLRSLTVTASEEIKHLLEGSNKPGSSRRIIGSPRQLENAVPTSKNPHGVWV